MKRSLGAAAVAGLVFVGCGGGSPPKAFPGSATDKARELVRLQKRNGLPPGNVEAIALGYTTVGDGFFCADKDPKKRKHLGLQDNLSRRERAQAIRSANLIVDVYCPWLSRFSG